MVGSDAVLCEAAGSSPLCCAVCGFGLCAVYDTGAFCHGIFYRYWDYGPVEAWIIGLVRKPHKIAHLRPPTLSHSHSHCLPPGLRNLFTWNSAFFLTLLLL